VTPRTTCASAILASRVPTADATVVARLRAAGAVLLGKLSLTEFAYGGYHPTTTPPVNPWAPDRWPGASSSGSGVAVAAGLAFGALGSDTGGSIRFPSAACGIVGLKPTYGRVSRAGVFPLAETLDHIGPMTRTVADAAALLSGIAGFDSSDPTSRRDPVPDYAAELVPDLRGVRIGVDEAYVRTDTEPEVAEAVLAATAVFRDAGAEIREIGGAVGIEAAARDWYVVCAAEAAAAHAPWFPTRAAEYGPTFRALLEDGTRLRATEYVTVDLGRQRVRRQIEDLWQAVDCLLCPSMPTLPPTVADFRSDAVLSREAVAPLLRFTAPFDFSGSPTLSVPCGVSRIGLPLSLQLVGRHGDEALLLRAGHAYETATPWTRRRPPI
jgi:amidase